MTKEQRAHEIAIAALPIVCELMQKNGCPASNIDPITEYKMLYSNVMDDAQITEIKE